MKAKLIDEREQKTFAVIFDKGDEFVSELTSFANENGLGASHFTAIGAFRDVMLGYFDPDTKKYVGPDAVIKKEIASIDSEKLAPNDKKGQLDELQSELKSPAEPVKFPANIDLVVKNYDKLNAVMPPVQ